MKTRFDRPHFSSFKTSIADVLLSNVDALTSKNDGGVIMLVYGYWNNKGGTGKTSLCFQSICFYAEQNPDKQILVVDVCPQANLSELLLGGLDFDR